MTTATAVREDEVMTGVIAAWELYRRSQLIGAGSPDLINAQSALLRLLEPHTRTLDPDYWAGTPDLEAIDDAADLMVAYIEFCFGTETASAVAGDDGDDIASQLETGADEAAVNGGTTSE
jgi:hypothetical protein